MEPRRLLVVAAFDPSDIIVPVDKAAFTGVGKIRQSLNFPVADCSAALLPSGRQVLTAAHCVESMPIDATYYLTFDHDPPLPNYPFTRTSNPATTDVFIHPSHINGLDHKGFDIAIIDLVPEPCIQCLADLALLDDLVRYEIFRATDGSDLDETDIVGYGWTGVGDVGENLQDGIKRGGKNKFEFVADAMNGAVPNSNHFPNNIVPAGHVSPPNSQLAFDFDNGLSANDAFRDYLDHPDLGFPNTEAGGYEVAFGGGDSGGPNFVDGKIAGVTSYGLWETLVTDVFPLHRSTFGEVHVAMRVAYAGDPNDPDDGHQDWIDATVDIKAPKVEEITFGTTLNNHADYVMPSGYNAAGQPGCSGLGCSVTALQLRTVPIALPNELSIRFNEDVNVHKDDLQVIGLTTRQQYHNSANNLFIYDPGTFTAKWTFNPPLAFNGTSTPDQIELRLSGVTDTNNVRLDAEWTNPLTTTSTNGSVFPSGNGNPVDGTSEFVFYVNFVPPDFNRDNVVDATDFSIWNANKFTGPHGGDGFLKGDATGNNLTDGLDFGVWNANKFTNNWLNWPSGQRPSTFGRGEYGPSAAWLVLYDGLLERRQIYRDGQINQRLSQAEWERFAEELNQLLELL